MDDFKGIKKEIYQNNEDMNKIINLELTTTKINKSINNKII